MIQNSYSILTPFGEDVEYKKLSEIAVHDLGLDQFIRTVTEKPNEQKLFLGILSQMSPEAHVAQYRAGVLKDVMEHPEMCDKLMKILQKIDFLKNYGSFGRDFEDKASMWCLMHRLDEIKDYIIAVEGFHDCLGGENLQSEGLLGLRDYVRKVHDDHAFEEMKQDIANLKADTNHLKSVTIGMNVNERFEPISLGLVSVNNKAFSQAPIVSNFITSLIEKEQVQEGTEWKEKYTYTPFDTKSAGFLDWMNKGGKMIAIASGPLYALNTLSTVPDNDFMTDALRGVDKQLSHMLQITTRKLKEVLDRYISVTITDMTNLIPEFLFYIKFSEFYKKMAEKKISFCLPEAVESEVGYLDAKGIFNLKLIDSVEPENIVPNDFDFSKEHAVYILTGANRGGKTTITQAVGQGMVLAGSGLMVPGNSFRFSPVDGVYTHFPADEDKTLDLGRLGEECKRFKELYTACTEKSLLLLNETFSTTSFEEGYYIAKDSIRAMLKKGVRTIYNTHMHKLGDDVTELNQESEYKCVSIIVETKEGQRSFKVKLSPPLGNSFAKDIAVKYGVTYKLLTEN